MSDFASLTRRQSAAAHRTSAPTPTLLDLRSGALPRQLKDERTSGGMPAKLAHGIESLSGVAMNNVRVHYNSSKPQGMQAHAYAQGRDIHLASGQEKHLPHEAWHVVQQSQGRVKPTTTVNGTSVNDSPTLEREADVMGNRALKGG